MDNSLETFGNRIREFRKIRGFSQEELAEKIDVTSKTISQWENGKSFLKYENIAPLCHALEISEADLFCFAPSSGGNSFIDKVIQIVAKISPAKQKQVLEILKTFLD